MNEHRFRAAAEECLDAARRAADPKARTRLLLMAQKWLEWAGREPVAAELSATPALLPTA
jgi:hypothetical protein